MPAATNLRRGEGISTPRSPDSTAGPTPRSVLDLVNLTPLMELTTGSPAMVIGLVDGPVALDHPDLAGENVRGVTSSTGSRCAQAGSFACRHGTFVAGILSAKRSSAAPAICPGCTLLVHPIFPETMALGELIPSATPERLATAILECINAGARVVNVSAALAQRPTAKGERVLGEALDQAAHRGVIVVAAAGNQGMVGSTAITQHPWVIAVIGCDRYGRPLSESNLGNSIGRRGLSAPGEGITSLGTDRDAVPSGGTSVAAPFVTGTIALVWSEFPDAGAGQVRLAVRQAHAPRRPSVVPALLNAWATHAAMREVTRRY